MTTEDTTTTADTPAGHAGEPTAATDDDARSTVTSQREVPPTHGGPGTNWTAVVVAVLGVLALVLVGYLLLAA